MGPNVLSRLANSVSRPCTDIEFMSRLCELAPSIEFRAMSGNASGVRSAIVNYHGRRFYLYHDYPSDTYHAEYA